MKKTFAAVGLLLAGLVVAYPQPPYKVVTHPRPPAREALDRLNLTLAWHTRLPIHGTRDGLASVQLLPGPTHPQLAVQTAAGVVALLDGETGDVLWRAQVGTPFRAGQPLAATADSILTTRGDVLFMLDRATGVQQLWTVAPVSRQREYGFHLAAAPSAAATVEEDAIYFSMTTKMAAYALPKFALAAKVKADRGEAAKETEASLQPVLSWSFGITSLTQQPPLLSGNQVSVVTVGGELVSVNKFDGRYRLDFNFGAEVNRPAAQHGPYAYVGADDGTLYAINMEGGGIRWRFLSASPLAARPAVTDADVFATVSRVGLHRLDRETGRAVWVNREAETFLAVNQKFVYAQDRVGGFHVLDGRRGTALAKYDLRDWTIPVANELTDRVYLASHDGQILCLHSRENPTPLALRVPAPVKRPTGKKPDEKAPDEKMPDEKAPDDKKPAEKEDKEKGAASGGRPRLIPDSAADPVVQARRAPAAAGRADRAGP